MPTKAAIAAGVGLGDWTRDDAAFAQSQGWDLFDTGERLEIQKLDEPAEGVHEFESDAVAFAFVHEQALKGCVVAKKAIRDHGKSLVAEPTDCLLVRLFDAFGNQIEQRTLPRSEAISWVSTFVETHEQAGRVEFEPSQV